MADIYMETVSLNDDEPSVHTSTSSMVAIDNLEAQMPIFTSSTSLSVTKNAHVPQSIVESDDEDVNDHDEDVVVIVDHQKAPPTKPRPMPPSLPPLRVLEIQKAYDDERDYVDTSLFSPEVSRHSMEQAHRRARNLESELKEQMALEGIGASGGAPKLSAVEAVSIISSAFVTTLAKMKQIAGGAGAEYDLLSGSSPQNKVEDLDTDGDGLQLSPDASRGDGKHFQSPKVKPALKRISAYSNLGKEKKYSQERRSLQWHEDVLDHDEEFVQSDEEDAVDGETEALMINGNGAIQGRQSTPRSKKKRKKAVRSMMRRLTAREKEELYKQRPDLMIVPNWAQKYREEMTEADSSRWGFWLMMIIGTLAVLLLILIVLIARDKAAAVAH